MSVQIKKLTKVYGSQKAVDSISLEAKPGEILGFLGPNGAGKTTTMKMVSCYLMPTEGEAIVCGHSVNEDTMAVRRNIGYLPENNPLYKDQYVREYLTFVAGVHGISKPASRVGDLIDMTGLEREQHKQIAALSKGYRQRVGLAQALMHDPQVLILDEPTSGLDPNQLVEIRSLIKQLGKEKTVIFSTHIMQEVQALCDRVVIIDRGRIVADDPIEELDRRISGQSALQLQLNVAMPVSEFSKIKGVKRVEQLPQNRYRLVTEKGTDVRADVFALVVGKGRILLELSQEKRSVEDIFQQLTKS